MSPRRLRRTIGTVGETMGAVATAPVRAVPTMVDALLWGTWRRSAPGAAPGQVVVDPEEPPPTISVIAYEPDVIVELDDVAPEQVPELLQRHRVTWVNVEGLGDARVLRALAETFDIHPLALEDVVGQHQRAKVEDYGAHQFVVLRMVMPHEGGSLRSEQVSLFVGDGYVVTFQEGYSGDSFQPVRARLRAGSDNLRAAGADYLAYALMDAVVDGYFPVLEQLSEELEALEEEVLFRPGPTSMARIHAVKRSFLALRRAIWPQREALALLVRDGNALFDDETRKHLRDVHDHTIQVIDLLETYRELASGLVDLYLSSVSNRMNEVMKVLTIIATIFIPLSFIAGVYGMNFDPDTSPLNMPELRWYFGYPFALALMGGVAAVLLAWFWRKGWLRAGEVAPRDE